MTGLAEGDSFMDAGKAYLSPAERGVAMKHPGPVSLRTFTATVFAVYLSTLCLADTIVKKNGKVLRGRVISQSDKTVVFEWTRYGRTEITIPMEQVASVTIEDKKAKAKKKGSGPGYVVLPLHGKVGKEITARILTEGLAEARIDKPDIVILSINSGGGDPDEAGRILDVIEKNRDLLVIAHVQDAISAAAVITLACPRIYIAPKGRIGGAVVYQVGPKGTPELVEEKFRSIYRAKIRRAPEIGGHSVLIARGMMEGELELSIVEKNGKPVVVEGLKGRPLKRKGRILTLNAKEAIACGLAKGLADKPETLNVALGVSTWHLAGTRGRNRVEKIIQDAEIQQRHAAFAAKKAAYMEAVAPTLAQIDELLNLTKMKLGSDKATMRAMERQYNTEVGIISAQYKQACKGAGQYSKSVAAELRLRAREIRDTRLSILRSRYQPQAAIVRARLNDLIRIRDDLNRRRRMIYNYRPK